MKVLILAEPKVPHTVKWVTSLATRGIRICLIGLCDPPAGVYEPYPNVSVHSLGFDTPVVATDKATFAKLRYLRAIPMVRNIAREFRPDIVHAHYATSYGLLGAVAGFRPLLVSVWGCDVYDFPNHSRLHEALLRWNLGRANAVLSTSAIMAAETGRYTRKRITVTPFGVDVEKFVPAERVPVSPIVIGTVKALEAKYGTEYLLRAFARLKAKLPSIPLKLRLVGGGSRSRALRELAYDLNVFDHTHFTGAVPFHEVADYHRSMHIEVFPSISNSESFGVAAIEAGACGVPVIVSNVGGLPEVVKDGITGIVVPPHDVEAIANALELLISDREMRRRMGDAGRSHVKRNYAWSDCLQQMIDIYQGNAKTLASSPTTKDPLLAQL